jgi:hypothetical protein
MKKIFLMEIRLAVPGAVTKSVPATRTARFARKIAASAVATVSVREGSARPVQAALLTAARAHPYAATAWSRQASSAKPADSAGEVKPVSDVSASIFVETVPVRGARARPVPPALKTVARIDKFGHRMPSYEGVR